MLSYERTFYLRKNPILKRQIKGKNEIREEKSLFEGNIHFRAIRLLRIESV